MKRWGIYCAFVFLGLFSLFISYPNAFSWGSYAHRQINKEAVYALPQPLYNFYKNNIKYLGEHASDPDNRKHYDTLEGQRHYIDVDHYGIKGFNELPRYWKAATEKYTQEELQKYGTLPYEVLYWLEKLTDAFKDKDVKTIVKASAYIGHYIADAHVPLHTVTNYDGQLTGQMGIHALWESDIPQMYADKYDFYLGKVGYIKDPEAKIFEIIAQSYYLSDKVFVAQKVVEKEFPGDKKYVNPNAEKRKYLPEYVEAYNKLLNGMVEKQEQLSVLDVAAFWYTAWVNAGQPDMRGK